MSAKASMDSADSTRVAVFAAGTREQGSALVVSVLLLIMVSALAMTSMRTVAGDQMVAGYQKQEQLAFYAAEGGVAEARALVREMGERSQVPDYPADFPTEAAPTELGQNGDYPNNVKPEYYADPDPADPIVYIGEGAPCTEGCNITLGGVKYNHTKWKINVIGKSPSGDTKKIELVATRLLAVGY